MPAARAAAVGMTAASVRRGLHRRVLRFGDLPLSWKLLVPSIGLMIVLGIVGGYLIVRDLSSRSAAALDLELSRRVLEARSSLRDAELSLIEAANFAANVEGMADAVAGGRAGDVGRLLESVVALKSDLRLVVATGRDGRSVVEFERGDASGPVLRPGGRDWRSAGFVRAALEDATGGKHSGLAVSSGRSILAVSAPVCSGRRPCAPVGAAVVGYDVAELAARVVSRFGSDAGGRAGFAVFDDGGERLAAAGSHAAEAPGAGGVHSTVGGVSVATVYSPFETSDARLGTLAISIPTEAALSSVRRTGVGLGLVLLAAMAGIAVMGILLSRLTVRRVRALVETNRALGRGDLAARAHVDWNDEIGELGARLNEMAEQLQAM